MENHEIAKILFLMGVDMDYIVNIDYNDGDVVNQLADDLAGIEGSPLYSVLENIANEHSDLLDI